MDLAEVQNGGCALIFPALPRNLSHPSAPSSPAKHPRNGARGEGGAPRPRPGDSGAVTHLMSCSPAKPGARRPRGSACAGGSPSRCGTSCGPRPGPRNPSWARLAARSCSASSSWWGGRPAAPILGPQCRGAACGFIRLRRARPGRTRRAFSQPLLVGVYTASAGLALPTPPHPPTAKAPILHTSHNALHFICNPPGL